MGRRNVVRLSRCPRLSKSCVYMQTRAQANAPLASSNGLLSLADDHRAKNQRGEAALVN